MVGYDMECEMLKSKHLFVSLTQLFPFFNLIYTYFLFFLLLVVCFWVTILVDATTNTSNIPQNNEEKGDKNKINLYKHEDTIQMTMKCIWSVGNLLYCFFTRNTCFRPVTGLLAIFTLSSDKYLTLFERTSFVQGCL